MKKIILTTDLSDESKLAFTLAKKLAVAFSSKIMLLCVIEDPTHATMAAALDFPVFPDPETLRKLSAKIEVELQELAKKELASVDHAHVLLQASGSVHAEIIKFAKDQGADLIVMSTHGRTGFSRLLLGSVTEKVVREAHIPVLTVPAT